MKNLFAFIEKHSFLLLFIVLQIVSIVFIVNFNEPQKTHFGAVSNAFRGRIHQATEVATQYFYLREINERLVEENARLYGNQKASLLDGNIIPSRVVDLNCEQQFEYFPAKVLNNSVNKVQNFITIDKGWEQGVQKNMAVICPTGIVGIVVRVSKHFSTVMTVLNQQFKVSAKFKDSGFYGSLSWNGKDYQIVSIDEIPLHAVINEGDTVVTNNYSNLFPSDITIGTVESYYQNGNFFTANVLLSTDFKRIEYVYLVKDLFKKERENIEKVTN